MLKPVIRWSKPNEGAALEELLVHITGICPEGMDWTEAEGWLVAEHQGAIIGAIQILMGKPMAHVGHLAVLPRYEKQGPAAWLALAAEQLLANSGADAVTGMIMNDELMPLAIRRGATHTGTAQVFMKRLPRKK